MEISEMRINVKKILILEDNAATAITIGKIVLSVENEAKIYTFDTLKGVYDLILNEDIQLFIVDIILNSADTTDVSGLQFVEKLRTLPQYEFVPVILVTALYDPKLYAYSSLHVYEYVEKPFDPVQVGQVIESALRFPSPAKQEEKKFHFKQDGMFYVIEYADILYIENYLHKIHIHLKNGKELTGGYRSCEHIVEEVNGSSLVQCSRRMFVNTAFIESVNWKQNTIRLKNTDADIRIGSTYKKTIREVLDVL